LVLLSQLLLPPRDRCELRRGKKSESLHAEQAALLGGAEFDLLVDIAGSRVVAGGAVVTFESPAEAKVLQALALESSGKLATDALNAQVGVGSGSALQNLRPLVASLNAKLKAGGGKVELTKASTVLKLPRKAAVVLPVFLTAPGLSTAQRRMLQHLGRRGTASLKALQDVLGLTRSVATREVDGLIKKKLAEGVREGRGKSYRLR
jgi:hypothetical protein